MYKGKKVYAIVLAGGSGARFGGDRPKQFQMLADAPVFLHSVRKFDKIDNIDGIVLVVPPDYLAMCQDLVAEFGIAKIAAIVPGGKSRQESTFIGLSALNADADSIIMVHDAARPFVSAHDISALIDVTESHGAAVLAAPIADTIKMANADKLAMQTIDRKNLYAAKTPQAAKLADMKRAHGQAQRDGLEATDDCQLMENIGIYPKIVTASAINIKITTTSDLDFAAFLIERGATL